MFHFHRIAIAGILSIVLFSGCGSNLASVEGTVTSNGQPLQDVHVEFKPADGRGSGATTDEAGHYRLTYTSDQTGALIGAHTVSFSQTLYKNEEERERQSGKEITIDFEQKVDVSPRSNVIDFEIPPAAIKKR